MQVKCKWVPKLSRYSDKVIKELLPKVSEVNNNFLYALTLDNLKYWKTSQVPHFSLIAQKLLQNFKELDTEEQISLFKYSILSQDNSLIQSILPYYNSFGFALPEQTRSKLISSIDSNNQELSNIISKTGEMKYRKEAFHSFLGHEKVSDIDISPESEVVVKVQNEQAVVFYGISQKEPQFSEILSLLEKFEIKDIVLPFQNNTPEIPRSEIQNLLKEKLKDSDKYKPMEIHKLVYQNILGVKSVHIPYSLVYKKPEMNYFTYYPEFSVLKTLATDFVKIEKVVELCMNVDSCRLINQAGSHGCYLCNKNRLYPGCYQDFALYSSDFFRSFLDICAQNIGKVKKMTNRNLAVFVDKRMMIGLVKACADRNKVKVIKQERLSEEDEMLARVFFDREKVYKPKEKLVENYTAIFESFNVGSIVPWRKEKFDFNCYTIKNIIKGKNK